MNCAKTCPKGLNPGQGDRRDQEDDGGATGQRGDQRRDQENGCHQPHLLGADQTIEDEQPGRDADEADEHMKALKRRHPEEHNIPPALKCKTHLIQLPVQQLCRNCLSEAGGIV
jgi:hypothetical protein